MKKDFKATQKFVIMSPRKLRLVVALVKKMKPQDAVEKLPFVAKRAGETLSKVIKSALANAKSQGISETDLIFKEIQVGEGPRLKRGRAASRGRWHQYKKRMSHIRVVLTMVNKVSKDDKPAPVSAKKDTKTASEVKKEKKENGTKS